MKTKKVKKEKIEKVSVPIIEVTSPSTEPKKVVISSFSGDFGREDVNLLRDKVNEIIDFLNK